MPSQYHMTTITVLYFGPAKEYTHGMVEETLALQECTLGLVLAGIATSHGHAFVDYIRQYCGVVVNTNYVDKDQMEAVVVAHGDEVTIVPPVSGG